MAVRPFCGGAAEGRRISGREIFQLFLYMFILKKACMDLFPMV